MPFGLNASYTQPVRTNWLAAPWHLQNNKIPHAVMVGANKTKPRSGHHTTLSRLPLPKNLGGQEFDGGLH